jgi:hypothetical protein
MESSYQGAVSAIRKLTISIIACSYFGESIMAEVDRPELFNQVLMLLALLIVTGLGLSVAGAQTSSGATATSGSGQYYFEFRSR